MRDDRGSFIKSQTQLTTELDALGATARGEGKGTHNRAGIDDDDDAFSASSAEQRQMAAKEGGFTEHYQPAPPRSPVSTTSPYSSHGHPPSMPSQAPPSYYGRSGSPAPSHPSTGYGRAGSLRNEAQYRSANNSSPWQRGAGYEH